MLHPEFEILSGDEDEGEATLHTGRIVPIYEAAGKVTTRDLPHPDAPHPARRVGPVDDRSAAVHPRTPEAAGPLDRDPRHPFPAAGYRPAPAQAFRSPAQFRLIFEEFFWLECGVALKRAKARADPGHRVRAQRPRARAGQGDAAVQAHRRAEARARQRSREDMAAAASHEPPAAGRRRQRQDHRGRRSGGDRHRERLSGGGAGAHRNPGHAARLLLSSRCSQQARAMSPRCSPARSPRAKRRSSRSWWRKGWCTSRSARTRCSKRTSSFKKLGLAIIDEQHRFGVLQRLGLVQKGVHARRAGDDRDADSAHARDDDVRRSGRLA